MPDPALLALFEHLSWTPPAIVESTPAFVPRPAADAVEAFVVERQRIVDNWISSGADLRRQLWAMLEAQPAILTVDLLTTMIERFDSSLKVQLRIATQFEKHARRVEKQMDPAMLKVARSMHDRQIAAVERFYEEGRDFALFLRALRSEIDPSSRGGPTFDNADDLEKFLLTQVG